MTVPAANTPSPSRFTRLLVGFDSARFFTVSMLVHVILVLLFGGVVISHVSQEPPDFVGGSDGLVIGAEDQLPPAPPPEISQSAKEFMPTPPAITAPPLPAIVTAGIQGSFSLPIPTSAVPSLSNSMQDAVASLSAKGLAEAAERASMGGRIGGMANVSFFGVKTKAKRIAFLVDYSGSMNGQFRLSMEKELERSLKGLPAGTQVLIIPWAGGAWLYNELASEIADKWEKLGSSFDDFAVRRGKKLATPEWVSITSENVEKLMKGVLAQKAWPGGTDWRSPFRYAMEAKPPPDTIFFMTDGQINDADRALSDIAKALRSAGPKPTVFSLWIENKTYKPDTLKLLAEKHKGELREVGPSAKP